MASCVAPRLMRRSRLTRGLARRSRPRRTPSATLTPETGGHVTQVARRICVVGDELVADVAQRRRVPYVETYAPLARHEQWLADLAAGDGSTPGQAGYGLMAWLVLHSGWQRWLGLPDDAP